MQLPVYVVSLKNALARRSYLEEMMAKYNVSYQVVDAVYGKELEDDYKHTINPQRNLKDSEIGCFLSHLECYEKFLETEEDYAVILEDDSLITDQFQKFINAKINKDAFDFLFLLSDDQGADGFVYQVEGSNFNIDDFSIYSLTSAPYSTNAYVISRNAALVMLRNNEIIDAPIDHYKNVKENIVFHAVSSSICFMNHLASVESITGSAWSPMMVLLRRFPLFYLLRDILKARFFKKYFNKLKLEKLMSRKLIIYRSGFRVVR